MAFASQPSASDGDRDPAASGTRRQLLTRRGSQDTPPRVVLHLPDLEALAAVTLGPPQPAARRRIDRSHAPLAATVETTTAATAGPSLLKLLKVPLGKLVPRLANGEGASLSTVLVMLQQPKMLLAAILAIGLQLAAVLAMLTGNSKPAPEQVAVQPPAAAWPATSPKVADGTVQTPLSLPSFASAGTTATPTLPPPQTLPGLDSRDLPPWPTDATSSNAVLPPVANQPARLTSPSLVLPTLAPPRTTAPIAEDRTSPDPSTLELPSPATPALGGPTPAISAAQTGDVSDTRPKARLQGTIKKASISGAAP